MDLFDKNMKIASIDFMSDLFDPYDNRRSYRSYHMSYAFIKLALKYPFKEIIFYHIGEEKMDRYMAHTIHDILRNYECFEISNSDYTVSNGNIRSNRGSKWYIKYKPEKKEHSNTNIIWNDLLKKL
jgi:hypothetical protein